MCGVQTLQLGWRLSPLMGRCIFLYSAVELWLSAREGGAWKLKLCLNNKESCIVLHASLANKHNSWQSVHGAHAWHTVRLPIICTCGTITCMPMWPWGYSPVLRLRLCACDVVVHGSSGSRGNSCAEAAILCLIARRPGSPLHPQHCCQRPCRACHCEVRGKDRRLTAKPILKNLPQPPFVYVAKCRICAHIVE